MRERRFQFSLRWLLLLVTAAAVVAMLIGWYVNDRRPFYPVHGHVLYDDGTPVVGATVTMSDLGSTYQSDGMTDNQGAFRLSALAGETEMVVVYSNGGLMAVNVTIKPGDNVLKLQVRGP